jgi:hypothetical protein
VAGASKSKKKQQIRPRNTQQAPTARAQPAAYGVPQAERRAPLIRFLFKKLSLFSIALRRDHLPHPF